MYHHRHHLRRLKQQQYKGRLIDIVNYKFLNISDTLNGTL